MLIFCLGLPRSGSTWLFNVVRGLLSESYDDFTAFFAETGEQFTERCPPSARNLLIKAHSVDDLLARTLDLAGVVPIITWRDPRDVVASMNEIGLGDPGSLARTVSGIGATIVGYRNTHPQALVLNYEDQFTEEAETIRRIAKRLGLSPSPARVKELYKTLSHAGLRDKIDRWSSGLGKKSDFITDVDLSTHWHKNHLGDGRIGKWKGLAPASLRLALDTALTPIDLAFRNPQAKIEFTWAPALFIHGGRTQSRWGVPADLDTPLVLTGPECCLPPGCWRLSFDVSLKPVMMTELKVTVDIGEVHATARHHVADACSTFWLEFDHRRPAAPLSVVVTRESPPERGSIKVSNVRAERLAAEAPPSEAAAARAVTRIITPM